MAEQTEIEIAIKAGDSAKTLGELKSAIKDLENLAIASGDANSDAFKQATQEAGKLRDRIDDMKDAVKSFKGDALEGLSKGFGSLKGRLSDLDFAGFNEEVKRMNTLSKQVSFKQLATSVGETGKSFLSLGDIIRKNPIFILVSVVTAIITNFDKLVEAGGLVGKIFGSIKAAIDFVVNAVESFSNAIGLTDTKAGEAMANIVAGQEKAFENIENRRNKAIAEARAYGKSDEEIQKSIALANKTAEEERRKEWQKTIDAGKEREAALKKQYENEMALYNAFGGVKPVMGKLSQEELDNITAANKGLEQINVEHLNRIGDENEKARTDEEAKRDAAEQRRQQKAAETAARIESERKQVRDYISLEDEKERQSKLDAEGKELRQAELKYEQLKKLANGNKDLLAKIEEDYGKKKSSIIDKYDNIEIEKAKQLQKQLDDIKNERLNDEEALAEEIFQAGLSAQQRELVALNDYYFQKIEAAKQFGLDTTALEEEQIRKQTEINDKYRNDELAKQQEKVNQQIALDQQIVDAQNQLNEARVTAVNAGFDLLNAAFGRNKKAQNVLFLAQRAFEASQVVINGLKNAAILKGQIAVATPLLANPATAPSATATIAAAAKGLVSNALTTGAGVASILATTIGKFVKPDSNSPDGGGPGPGGGGGGGGAPAPTPTFTSPQFFGLGQGQLQGGAGGPQTQQVVVLENDITRTQNRVRVIENRATIG